MKEPILRAARLAALALVAAPLGAGGADRPLDKAGSGGAPSERLCFRTRDVTNFAAADGTFLNVRVKHRDVYQLEMIGLCSDIASSQRITLVSRGSNDICDGNDIDIVTTPAPVGPQRCRARQVRLLTHAEVAALPRLARP